MRLGALNQLKFASLVEQGLPEERATYFLDPWNSPYWYQHRCNADQSVVTGMIYSFGPDRKRDSTDHEIKGDDIGIIIFAKRPKEKAAE